MGKLSLAVASALLLSSATALAATSAAKDQTQHSAMQAKAMAHTASAAKETTTKDMAHRAMSAKAMASKAMTHEAMSHKAWHKAGATKSAMHKTAWHKTSASTGERVVQALNTLEAAGYRSITGVHPKGMNIVATAVKAGKTQNLTVTPAGKIMPTA